MASVDATPKKHNKNRLEELGRSRIRGLAAYLKAKPPADWFAGGFNEIPPEK
jgi:hypothetical protein